MKKQAIGEFLATPFIQMPSTNTGIIMQAFTPIGARHRSGSGNAITEFVLGYENKANKGCKVLSNRAPGVCLTVSSTRTPRHSITLRKF
jgi:hypothetical protein